MLRRRRIAYWGSALLLALGASPATPQNAALTALRSMDNRVATIGHRLATANLSLCRERQWQAGLQVHDLSQYSRAGRAAAAAAFNLHRGPAILALAAQGAAERAGLRLDDILLAADGVKLPRPAPEVQNSFAPTERIIEAIESALADGSADLTIERGGEVRAIRLTADQGCASRFQLVPSARMHAKADGRYVQLTSALVQFTRDDHELAGLLAHELAHNILRHRARLNQAGVERGLLAGFGRNGRLFRRTELEADRLAVHLMHRAGYDPSAAVRLWTRQSRSDSPLAAGTHPDWPTRIAALQAEIEAIRAAAARGETAPPPLADGPLDPRAAKRRR
jgi:beta-barrel assembly-enhancing protease